MTPQALCNVSVGPGVAGTKVVGAAVAAALACSAAVATGVGTGGVAAAAVVYNQLRQAEG